jgi:hypothetical protein
MTRTLRVARGVVGMAMLLALGCGRSDPPRLKVTELPVSPAGTTTGAAASTIDARFQLRNVGGRPLALDEVVPACGCAVTSRLPATLASGASTTLAATYRVPAATGRVVRELRLRTSDPQDPETPLRVTVAGRSAAPEPSALYFGYVAVGESAVRDVVLPAAVGVLAPSPRPDLTLEPLPARADGALGVRVTFAPSAPGIARATLDLGAAGALPVIAIGYESLMAFPSEIRVPRPTGAAGLPSVTLVALGDAAVAMTTIDYPPGVSGELKTIVPGRQFRLVLRGRATAGEIRVHGGAAHDPLLTIPVVDAAGGDLARPPA